MAPSNLRVCHPHDSELSICDCLILIKPGKYRPQEFKVMFVAAMSIEDLWKDLPKDHNID